uniref:retinitis pigmentosa 1-like 1 protein n=1 Tax=Euleptes europaea TaxID=460621 RepID=UPI0025422DE4|nr:retinitis pigmentosa 1-like 1 protein [Euleptes europaea]
MRWDQAEGALAQKRVAAGLAEGPQKRRGGSALVLMEAHVSPFLSLPKCEELQQSLTSLQIQMQHLDDLEIWKVPQEPPSEEPTGEVDEENQSPDGPETDDGPALLSSEGRSGAKSALESAPAARPHGPRSTEAEDNLPNGELQDGDLFGNECSPEEAKVEAIPKAVEKGGPPPHQGSSEAASAANPAGQSLHPGKAPAARQRKLAMEEIVIRDHLGQEVGCMDAVGQDQNSLEKEEELEGHTDSGDRRDSCGQSGPVDGVPDRKEAPGEGPPVHELGSREGPEGESSTSEDHQDPSRLLQNENSDPEGQGNGPLEMGSLAEEAGGEGVGQKEVPGQGAQETEPALALATANAPTTETEMPEQQESGAREEGRGPRRPGSQLDQTRPGAQTTSLLDQPVSPLPEDEPLALEDIPSSWHEMGKAIPQQEQELLGHEEKGSLPDSIPSLTDQLTSLPDQIVSLQEAEETPVPLRDQTPVPPEAQVSPLPGADVFLPSQDPPSADDPCESPVVLLDQIPPALQDTESSSPVGRTPASSLQEASGVLPDEIQTPLPIHTSPDLPEDEGTAQAPPTLEDQSTASQLGQAPSPQDPAKAPPEGQNSSDDPPEEKSTLAERTPSPNKAQRSPGLQDASVCPNALPSSTQETLQPLLDKAEALETPDAKEGGKARAASDGAGEITEVLGNLHAEQQPLLKEAKAAGAPPDISVGDPQPKAGVLKSPGATSRQAPNNSPRTSANTAYSRQLQTSLPRQGQDQEPSKGKRQSCQCCVLM